jgi:hypothetical protein
MVLAGDGLAGDGLAGDGLAGDGLAGDGVCVLDFKKINSVIPVPIRINIVKVINKIIFVLAFIY